MNKLRRAYRWASRTSAGVLDDLTLEGGMWIFIVTALAVIAGLVWGEKSTREKASFMGVFAEEQRRIHG